MQSVTEKAVSELGALVLGWSREGPPGLSRGPMVIPRGFLEQSREGAAAGGGHPGMGAKHPGCWEQVQTLHWGECTEMGGVTGKKRRVCLPPPMALPPPWGRHGLGGTCGQCGDGCGGCQVTLSGSPQQASPPWSLARSGGRTLLVAVPHWPCQWTTSSCTMSLGWSVTTRPGAVRGCGSCGHIMCAMAGATWPTSKRLGWRHVTKRLLGAPPSPLLISVSSFSGLWLYQVANE